MISILIPCLKWDAFATACRASLGHHDDVEIIIIEGVCPVGEARNQALEKAHGDWIFFVDADDLLAPNWHALLTQFLARHPEADLIAFDRTPTFPPTASPFSREETIHLAQIIPEDLHERLLTEFIFRRTLLTGLRFSTLVRGEDRLFANEAFLRAHTAVLTDAKIYGYRQHPASTLHQPWNEQNFGDELSWRLKWLTRLTETGFTLDRRCWRLMGLNLLEYRAADLQQLSDPQLRERLHAQWLCALTKARHFPFPWPQKLALWAVSTLRYHFIETLFCHLPFALKQWLHRRAK